MSRLFRFHQLRKYTDHGDKLFDIDTFDIPGNTCIVLSGQNGAGKTTLLKILAGLERPDRAEVTLEGRRAPWQAVRARLRRTVVYLHQQPYMFDRSVADNIAYGLRRRGLRGAALAREVGQALQWAGLSHLAQRNARALSGGEKQRVALTRARVLAPRLLLLDEPLANMDIGARRQSIALIRGLAADGISSILTSHEPDISSLLGDEHRHLCKTGPCRYTIVEPFLYERAFSSGTAPGIHSERNAMTDTNDRGETTAVILAGGMARRMGGQDKGLLELNARPMIEYIIEAIAPQVDHIVINANRNLDAYRRYGYPVVEDMMGEYFGPLVGMASALRACSSERILTVPCDSPFVPPVLAQRLGTALVERQADISVARDGERMQPVFALIRRHLLDSLIAYLEAGGRKIDTWYAEHRVAEVDFSDWPDAFVNINTPEDQALVAQTLSAQQAAGRS